MLHDHNMDNEKIIEKYSNHLRFEKNLSDNTIRNYLSDLAVFKIFLNIEEFSYEYPFLDFAKFISKKKKHLYQTEYRKVIVSFLTWLVTKKTNISRNSVIRNLASLRSFFRFCIEEKFMPEAPLWNSRSYSMKKLIPKKPQMLPEVLQQNEISYLLDSPNEKQNTNKSLKFTIRDISILEILYGSGLRLSEVGNLNVNNIDLTKRTVTVLGKGNKQRQVPLSLKSTKILQEYINNQRRLLIKRNSEPGLFLNKFGGRLSNRSIQNLVKSRAKIAGLPKRVHTHMIRHSFATHLLDGGADIRIVQMLLGHSSPDTTQIYTHVSTSQARKVYLDSHPFANINK
ncbi:MAG: recombinase XerC [Chloroflexi bacterium]|nr:recombinase XerC [Chloroflexota bacterium]|tara:strand:+ start:1335 stop:2357 length:1023 start_codon:yes stop_codon:yes gene_type:complete